MVDITHRTESTNKTMTKSDDDLSIGGVFVSTKNFLVKSSSSISADMDYSDLSSGCLKCSPPTSWRSSADKEHLKNIPLYVSNPDNPIEITDEQETLGKILCRSKRLPGPSFYANNVILVNQERTRRLTAPLTRLHELDELAREHAKRMAEACALFHSSPDDVQTSFHRPCRRLGENVKRGDSIINIHKAMMKDFADRSNILDRRYTNMGMGTAKGSDGHLYLCQLFRG